MRICMKVLKAV
ncbi:hypothetical protein N7455_000546 [Penicillium solitum]|nr:hypothetical protein N7455_000546 [Penicillium solitum]